MDIHCANCREPWNFDFLLHELPYETDEAPRFINEFIEGGGVFGNPDHIRDELAKQGWQFGSNILVVLRCEACKGKPVSETADGRSMAYQAIADILGDDIDGLAAELEDFDLLFRED